MFRLCVLVAFTASISHASIFRRLSSSSSSPTQKFKMNGGRIDKKDMPSEGRTQYRYIPDEKHGKDVAAWSFYLKGNTTSTESIHCPKHTFYYDTYEGFGELTSFSHKDSGLDSILVKDRVFPIPIDPFLNTRLDEIQLTDGAGTDVMKLLARRLGSTTNTNKRTGSKGSPKVIDNMPDLFAIICEIYEHANSRATF